MGESEIEGMSWDKVFRQFHNVIAIGTRSSKVKAMETMTRFFKHAPEHVLSGCIPILIEILRENRSNDSGTSIKKVAAYCLRCIGRRSDELIGQMSRDGAAESLLRLMPNSNGKFLEILAICLLIVVTLCVESRINVFRNNGVEIIVNLLNSCEDDLNRKYLLEILTWLALLRHVRKEIIRLDARHLIVEAVGAGSMLSRERACYAIGVFALTKEGRQTLVNLGVIPAVVDLFRIGDQTTKLIAGTTLGVISGYVDCMRSIALHGAIPLYAQLLQGPDPSGRIIAFDVFCVLNMLEANAIEIMEHLVRILREEGHDIAKIIATNVVLDIINKNHSTPVILNSGVIPVYVEILSSGSEILKESAIYLLTMLSNESSIREVLHDVGAIPVLAHIFHSNNEELSEAASEVLFDFLADPLYHDITSAAIGAASSRGIQSEQDNNIALDDHVSMQEE